jgi:hypothetical protein
VVVVVVQTKKKGGGRKECVYRKFSSLVSNLQENSNGIHCMNI